MGGAAGCVDAMIGAVEAQQAEGVLHLHLFMFMEMANQFVTLQEMAELFQYSWLLRVPFWQQDAYRTLTLG